MRHIKLGFSSVINLPQLIKTKLKVIIMLVLWKKKRKKSSLNFFACLLDLKADISCSAKLIFFL